MIDQSYLTLGQEISTIPVQLSYRIIELFSEGLYSSPNKAIEELVSNAFDAGANNVHVVLSPDPASEQATIVVADDGISMDERGLRQHWYIGVSDKRKLSKTKLPKGRKQIGKFGIGKLATFVLARYLTHICKHDGTYYAVTMDYSDIPEGVGGGVQAKKKITLPLRELTSKEAQTALDEVLKGTKLGYKCIKFFGRGAASTWTVAILSGLKDMAQEIEKGRLSWVLRTAMPVSSEFRIFLNGDPLTPARTFSGRVEKWTLGKELLSIPKPAPNNLKVSNDKNASSEHRYGFIHPTLGRITGYAEIYKTELTKEEVPEGERRHGFFIYVRGRLINTEDKLPLGLPALRHGTYARFRMVVHIDSLDEELRSTRENVREGEITKTARNLLHGVFNYARTRLNAYEDSTSATLKAASQIAQSAGSLTRRPIIGIVRAVFEGKADPRYISVPENLSRRERQEFLEELEEQAATDEGLVLDVALEDLLQHKSISVLDVSTRVLQINALHPFVAAHRDDYEKGKKTLSLLAMAEVLTEAYLYELGLEPAQVHEVMNRRDELLRQFASDLGRNANMVAQALEDAITDENKLEEELVSAFYSLGFNASRIGGNNKPDGKAEAPLGFGEGKEQRYAVSLEAKSKREADKIVSAKSVGVSTIARQRDDYDCEHAVVAGPNFPTTKGDDSALIKETKRYGANKDHPDRTITFIKIYDLARLVRLQALKGLGLDRIRQLFIKCISPQQASAWINSLEKEEPKKPPYKAILETIWELQNEVSGEAIGFGEVKQVLRLRRKIDLKKEEIKDLCRAMSRMTPQYIFVRDLTVELAMRPNKIIEAAGEVLQDFPEEEQKKSIFKL